MSPDSPATGSAHAAFLPPAAPPPDAAKKRRGIAKFLLTLPLYAAFGAALGWLGARSGLRLRDALPDVSLPGVLVAAVLMFWPNVVLHEAGHALAGLSRGMRALAYGIGPLRWERGQSGWRFRRGGGLGGISGFAALLPQGERGLSRMDQAIYLAGGPLANLLTAALAFASVAWGDVSRGGGAFLVGTGLCAAFLGVLNLVPFHTNGWRSDGRGLLDLLRRAPDADLQQRINQLLALSLGGVRPRDWPAALVPGPASTSASLMLAINGDLLRLSWAMDRGDDAAASDAARRATAGFHRVPAPAQPHVAVGLAGHAARVLRDRAVLAAWRPLCEGGLTDLALLRAWLDAELAALSGDADATRAAIARARGLLGRAPDPVTALQLQEYLDEIADRSLPPAQSVKGA